MKLLLTILLVLSPALSHATTYYVSTTGNNGNSGAEDAPWATIAFAATTMVAGDTTYVRGGTYSESGVRFRTTGTQASPIKLLAYPNELPILSCTASTAEGNSITIRNNAGSTTPMGWITIDGLKIQNCNDGIKGENVHNSTFTHLWLLNNDNQGVLITGAHDNIFAYSIVQHSGDFLNCTSCTQQHGLYLSGKRWQIHHNVFVDNLAYGVQQNGSSSANNAATVPDAAFQGAQDWVISDNTFAYQSRRAGIVVWGSTCTNFRIENNIFFENAVVQSSSVAQGVDFVSATGVTGGSMRNNHFYASGSGGQAYLGTAPPSSYTNSGNIVNVSAPAFVDGGSNSLPASPDFRLTASSPVNIALTNEYPNNSTLVVGAFKTVADPTCSITADRMTCTYASVTPIRNLSAAGVTIGCTGSACPGSPTASTVQNIAGTDSQFETVITGIAGNACVSLNQTWTKTYNASMGTWTGGDNIGPYPGLHQKMFSFTSLAVTNACTGSGPPTIPGTPYIEYLFTDGSGTTVTNTGSAGAGGNGTLSSGVTWGTGSVTMTGGTSQSLSIPYGNLVDPSATDLTVAFLVNLPAGQESLSKIFFGAPLDAAPIEERFYISMLGNTLRLGIQAANDGTATDLATNAGLMHVCVTANATTNTVTLHKNGVASVVAGGVRTVTSYAIPGNFQLGLLPGSTNGPTATYSHFQLYQSVEDCDALYQAAIAPPATPTGTFSQTGVQFEAIHTELNGSVIILPSPNRTKKVAKGGAVGVVLQVECDNCQQTAFRLAARDNGTGSWLQVPTTETAANLYMLGTAPAQYPNTGTPSTRVVANGCTIEAGATLLTAAQIPSITLPASGCTMLRYLLRVRSGASGYTEVRVEREGGIEFTGSYSLGRIDIINQQAGVGF